MIYSPTQISLLKLLSHSSNETVERCPRKYELYRLGPKGEEKEDSEDLSFGKIVGIGVQSIFMKESKEVAIWKMFLAWKRNLFDEDGEKKRKTFWWAMYAFEKFLPHFAQLSVNYELVYVDGKPAVELGFRVFCLDDFKVRGFIDCVLRDKRTGQLLVFELKTTRFKEVHPAMYKNSGQALGYSLILDYVSQKLGIALESSFKVLYYVYKTSLCEYEALPFPKSHLQRAVWIKSIMQKTEQIGKYIEDGIFPMHGWNCFSFSQPCQFFDICEMNTELLVEKNPKVREEKAEDFSFNISLIDLVNSQLAKHH